DGRPASTAAARMAARHHENRRYGHRGRQHGALQLDPRQCANGDDRRRKETGRRVERRSHHAAMTGCRPRLAIAVGLLVSAALSVSPSAQRRGGPPPGPPKPTPHWPDGRVNLGPPPGEKGLWTPAGIVQLSVNPKSVNRANARSHLPDNIT